MAQNGYHSEDDHGETGLLLNEDTGLPIMTEEEVDKAFGGGLKALTMFLIVPRLIGLGIALLIVHVIMKWEPHSARIGSMVGFNPDIGYIFLAIGFFSLLVSFMNMYPMVYKGAIMGGNAGNLRSNMHIFKVNYVDKLGEAKQQLPYVVMEEDGEIGEYNRANRALFHFTEHGVAIGLNIVAAGLIYSKIVFVVTILYVLARIWYQAAYAQGGYGMGCCKHAVPFMFHNILCAPIFEMLVWLTGVVMLAHPCTTYWTGLASLTPCV